MITKETKSAELDLRVVERPAEDAEQDLVEVLVGAQKQPTLDRPRTGLDQGAPLGDVALGAWQTLPPFAVDARKASGFRGVGEWATSAAPPADLRPLKVHL